MIKKSNEHDKYSGKMRMGGEGKADDAESPIQFKTIP